MSLQDDLLNLSFRERPTDFSEIFPRLNRHNVGKLVAEHFTTDRHKAVFEVARALWSGGYDTILHEQRFHQESYKEFSGHCHQCTPALGLALHALGFPRLAYLECYRIREHFPETGIIEQVPPDEELNPDVRKEFCDIGRIPYCCLEIFVEGKPFYLTGKHLRPHGDGARALLRPQCYQDIIGVFPHQDDPTKSGVYLQPVIPAQNPKGIDFTRQVVWMKQTESDPAPEFFATFLRMPLH